MNQGFFEQLTARVQAADSLLCVGLDPRAENADDARSQCLRLIDATHECAAAFKVNSAFFEVWGAPGIKVLREVIAYVPPGIPVILDAKRGDIAETSEAYARAAFDTLGAQAVTVNPYLGGEALAPFLARAERGVFVLCKTSNRGADEFQMLRVNGQPLYEIIAQRAAAWNTRGNVGLVLGATDTTSLARVRELTPTMWFLVPGIGAQGGNLEMTLAAGLRADGLGLLIHVSRALANVPEPRTQAEQLCREIRRLSSAKEAGGRRQDQSAIRNLQSEIQPSAVGRARELADILVAAGCVRFGDFTLKSGQRSPIYLDLRRLVSHPAALRWVAQAYVRRLRDLSFDRIAAIPYAALPIATLVACELDKPLLYPRREVKDYGTRAAIEGEFREGEAVVVLDDLATTGETKFETVEKLAEAGLRVRDIVVLIDREQGAREALARAGYALHAITTLTQLLDEWQTGGVISKEQYVQVKEYLERTSHGV